MRQKIEWKGLSLWIQDVRGLSLRLETLLNVEVVYRLYILYPHRVSFDMEIAEQSSPRNQSGFKGIESDPCQCTPMLHASDSIYGL